MIYIQKLNGDLISLEKRDLFVVNSNSRFEVIAKNTEVDVKGNYAFIYECLTEEQAKSLLNFIAWKIYEGARLIYLTEYEKAKRAK